MDYQNGKIYRLVCEETGRQYIGSTSSTLTKRLHNHKYQKSKCASHDFINPKIFLIEDYPCDRKDQLLMRERFHIENTDCVNLNRPIISQQERKEQVEKYYLNNREARLQYYETHKEQTLADKKTKITCECGAVITKGYASPHKKSKKHQKFISIIFHLP